MTEEDVVQINEERIEGFRLSLERLLHEGSNITSELMQSSNFQDCVDRHVKSTNEDNDACELELVEDFERFSIANGIKLNSSVDRTGLVFVDEVCPDGMHVWGSFLDGKPHGFFRILNKYGDLLFFGCFIHGEIHGPNWKGLVGRGFLLNPSCDKVDFSGFNIVYLYPDCQTVFVGKFEEGSMVSARASEVLDTQNSCCGLPLPIFGPFEEPFYSLDVSTESVISRSPLLPDPYEGFFVYVSESQIPDAGEGLFAKINVEPGTVLAFYNGIRKPTLSPLKEEEAFQDTPYKISLSKHMELDIPPEYTSLDNYTASLAHKVCHSFTPNCEFDKYDHPRFGIVISLVSTEKISAGTELTVNYKYDLSVAPAWYKKTWAKNQKKLRGMPNWQTALTRQRKYRRTASSLRSSQLPK